MCFFSSFQLNRKGENFEMRIRMNWVFKLTFKWNQNCTNQAMRVVSAIGINFLSQTTNYFTWINKTHHDLDMEEIIVFFLILHFLSHHHPYIEMTFSLRLIHKVVYQNLDYFYILQFWKPMQLLYYLTNVNMYAHYIVSIGKNFLMFYQFLPNQASFNIWNNNINGQESIWQICPNLSNYYNSWKIGFFQILNPIPIILKEFFSMN